MHAYLITGASQNQRTAKAKEIAAQFGQDLTEANSDPDILIVEAEPSVGIEKIRKLQTFLSRKAYQGKYKIVFIPQAEKLTIAAQNAFLKTLEEPPAASIIILSAQSKAPLLETITSRCQLVNLPWRQTNQLDQQALKKQTRFLTKLLKASPGERLTIIAPYTRNRAAAVNCCRQLTACLRQQLTDKVETQLTDKAGIQLSNQLNQNLWLTVVKQVNRALVILEANANVKLTLRNLVINLPKITG